jgi:hypothetical protein
MYGLPPILKSAETLLVEVERAVISGKRIYRNGYGSDLRQQAQRVAFIAHKAWWERENQPQWSATLKDAVDDLKLRIQIGGRIHAFSSFGKFEQLARLAADLGRQVGGWYKKQHPKGQNDRRYAVDQRAKILSSQATQTRVNP